MARKSKSWNDSRSKLRKKLSVILPKEIKKGVQDAVLKAAKIIEADAKALAPKDTGELANAIKIAHKGDKMGAKIGYFKKGNKRNWKKAGWRMHFVEFGTRGGFSKGGWAKVTPQKARPFLGPAYRKNHKKVVGIINSAVNRALQKVARGQF